MQGVRKDDGYQVLERKPGYEGSIVSISTERFLLPNGIECEYDLLELPDVVAVVPLLEVEGEAEPRVVLLEHFRHAVGGFIHEIPAGHVEEGEDPLESARRELREETGFDAARWTELASPFTIPGLASQRMHYFLAEELTPGEQSLESSECLEVREWPLSEVLQELTACDPSESRIVDTKTHVGLLHTAMRRANEGAGA
jgi:ADP-ribose pyrophosphatase